MFEILHPGITLDGKTLIGILFWGHGLSAALIYAFLATYSDTINQKLARCFIRAEFIQALAFLLILYPGRIPGIPGLFTITLGSTLLLVGFYWEALAILQLAQEKKHRAQKIMRTVLLLALITFNGAAWFFPTSTLSAAIVGIGLFGIQILPVLMLLLTKGIRTFKPFAGAFHLFFIFLLLLQAIYTLFRLVFSPETNISFPHILQSSTLLVLVLLMIFRLPAYLLLMKENADILMNQMATTDYLTGLLNRHSFLDLANLQFERHKREKKPTTFLFMDIDHFKIVNDTYGHAFGDEVLICLSTIIRQNMREYDLPCRYGGEEFVAFIANSEAAVGQVVAKRILQEIAAAYFPLHPDFHFTISIGIAIGVPQMGDTVRQYIHTADKALYEAKRTGRNKIVEHSVLTDFRENLSPKS